MASSSSTEAVLCKNKKQNMSHLPTYNLPNKTTCKILTYLYNMMTKYWKLSIEILMVAESLISITVKDPHMA